MNIEKKQDLKQNYIKKLMQGMGEGDLKVDTTGKKGNVKVGQTKK